MMKEYYTRTTCRLCESDKIENVMNFPETPIGDEYVKESEKDLKQTTYPLDLAFCHHCGFLQIPNVVSPELLYRNYIYETNSSLNLADHFQAYANTILGHLKIPVGSRVYEVGCNDGTFLSCFQKAGMNAIGIEPATKISQKAASRGLSVVNDFFCASLAQKLGEENGKADLICANNVLANIDDLKDFFKGVRSLLKDDGVFVFESGYMIDLVVNDVIDNIYHEHLSYFSIHPLLKHLKDHGLMLFDVEHVSTKGGSMRYFIQKLEGKRVVSDKVIELHKKEVDGGFTQVKRFHELNAKHNAEKEKLIALLKDLKAEGKKIAGFGASVGVTTLLYYYGVDKFIEFLADDNVSRHGLYSPGKHLKVVSPSKLYDEKIDYVVCFPWRYINPIKNKHTEFHAKGGKFILPLPAVEVV